MQSVSEDSFSEAITIGRSNEQHFDQNENIANDYNVFWRTQFNFVCFSSFRIASFLMIFVISRRRRGVVFQDNSRCNNTHKTLNIIWHCNIRIRYWGGSSLHTYGWQIIRFLDKSYCQSCFFINVTYKKTKNRWKVMKERTKWKKNNEPENVILHMNNLWIHAIFSTVKHSVWMCQSFSIVRWINLLL